jgi:hypothetical protein
MPRLKIRLPLSQRLGRALATLLAAVLPALSAHASGDGDLCAGPVNAAFCAGVLALKALTPATRAERMESAVMRVDVDTLRRMKAVYPTEFNASDLLALAAGRYVARDFAGVPVARQREMLDFLVDAVGDMASPAIVKQIGFVACSDRPEAREVLEILFARGATARDVEFNYRDNCHSAADVVCGTLGLLLEHGLDANRHGRFERILLREALAREHFVDAQALLDHGADPKLEDVTPGAGGLVDLLVDCPPATPMPNGTLRDRGCWNRTRAAIVFMAAHGADIDGAPAGSVACWTLQDQAEVSRDDAALELLKSLHADPAAGDRCRARARQKMAVDAAR